MTSPANPRALEPRLASCFQEALLLMPPATGESDREALATVLVADAVPAEASDIQLDPGTIETRVRLRMDGVMHDGSLLPNAAGHRPVPIIQDVGSK